VSGSFLELIAQAQTPTPTPTPTPAPSVLPPDGWEWVLALIAIGTLAILYFLYRFYKRVQDSSFVEKLLGLPVTEWPPGTGRRWFRRGASETEESSPAKSARTAPARGVFRFAEEFLARRAEFWLLYAQVFLATFFIAAIAALMLVGVVTVEAGLPALSTVVGIVLGKTVLSAKGTPLTAQEQAAASAGGPNNLTPPTVSLPPEGSPTPLVLTASPGEWSGQLPIEYAYAWRRRPGSGKSETEVTDATELTYELRADDSGAAFAVVVTATNSEGSATAMSAFVTVPG
jgi:membrane protein implicated in regulation of membrane protease activity